MKPRTKLKAQAFLKFLAIVIILTNVVMAMFGCAAIPQPAVVVVSKSGPITAADQYAAKAFPGETGQ